MPSLRHDLRYALRNLRKSPGFTAVAILTIAIAIGANTALFSFVDGVLLKPLPNPDANRIVQLLERRPDGGRNAVSTLNYLDWVKQNTIFRYMAARTGWSATLTGDGEPVQLTGNRVTAQFFDVFGIKPALGRTFLPGEDQPGKDHVVILSHALWESRFGADPGLIGGTIRLNGEPYTVVGVFKKGPFDRSVVQIWTPLAFTPANMTRDFHWFAAYAKLQPGVTLTQARARMHVIGARIAKEYPASNKGWNVAVDRYADRVVGPQLRTAVLVLFVATAFVLLIACANLANLALARGLAREREVAVRASLGAGRWRLARQFLTENVVLSVCGGLLGIGIGYATMKWIQFLLPPFTLPAQVSVQMDARVMVFAFAAALVTGLLFGLAPAVQATRADLTGPMKEGGHGAAVSGTARRLRNGLAIAEVALAFVLLVGSGLLMRSFFRLLAVDPGFDPTNVLTAGLPIAQKQHPDPVELNAYLNSIRAAVDAVPGVRETALTSALPLQGWGYGMPYQIAGRPIVDRAHRRAGFFKMVSPSYFHALGIKLLEGRGLSRRDTADSVPVMVINETLARRAFPKRDPIGQRILVQRIVPGKTELGPDAAWQVVGVIADEKINGLNDDKSAGMYVSNVQSPVYNVSLVVRANLDPRGLEKAVRTAIESVDKNQALTRVRTLTQIEARSTAGRRVTMTLLGVFAGIALLLAALGIYGVISYAVAQRTHELGIRAALGASTSNLLGLAIRSGLRLTLIGLALGLLGSLAVTRVLASMLFDVGARDPATMAAVAAILALVAAVACFVPARRATRVDPIAALRYE